MKVREDPSWGIEGTCWMHQASLTSNEPVPATCPGEENDMTLTDQTLSDTFICQIVLRHTNISCPEWETILSTHLHSDITKHAYRNIYLRYMHLIRFQAQIWTHCKIKKFIMAGNGFWMSDFIVHKEKTRLCGRKSYSLYSLFSMSYCYVSENRSKVKFFENPF